MFGANTVRAQDEDIEIDTATEDTLEDTLPHEGEGVPLEEDVIEVDDTIQLGWQPSPDAETSLFFPSGDDSRFPVGSTVTIIVGFKNVGTGSFRINDIEASFRFVGDFSYAMWNFTQQYLDIQVIAGDMTTIVYQFTPHENFDIRDYGFQLKLNYFDGEGAQYQDLVMNTTIQTVESLAETDYWSLWFKCIVGVIAAFYIYRQVQSVLGIKPTTSVPLFKPSAVERGTSPKKGASTDDVVANNEWLSDLRLPATPKAKKVASPRLKTA